MTDIWLTTDAIISVDTFSKPRKSGKKEKSVVAETPEDDTDDEFFEE